uniref:Movement protein n=1 Tax=Bursaphelenchus xylophilus TaxID=6326 RepID=A0A1I7S6J6_BURXY
MVRVPASLSPARTRSNRTYGIQHVRRNNFVMSQPNSVLAYLQSYKSDSSEEEEEVPAPTAPAPSSALPSTTTGFVSKHRQLARPQEQTIQHLPRDFMVSR